MAEMEQARERKKTWNSQRKVRVLPGDGTARVKAELGKRWGCVQASKCGLNRGPS